MDHDHDLSNRTVDAGSSRALAVIPPAKTALLAKERMSDGARSHLELTMRLQELRIELEILQSRIRAIKRQTRRVAGGSVRWIDASARDQLGNHPWLKLSAASFAAFITGRLLRQMPLGLLAIAARPLLVSVVASTSSARRT